MVINLRRGRRTRHNKYRHHRKDLVGLRYRAFLNGVDVSINTFYVDSRRGVIRMFVRDVEGLILADPTTGEPIEIERRGNVKLVRKKLSR